MFKINTFSPANRLDPKDTKYGAGGASVSSWWKPSLTGPYRSRMSSYAIAVFTGALIGRYAFPPFQLGFLAYAGLLPFLYWSKYGSASSPSSSRAGSLKYSFKVGYWWGFGFHAAGLYWILNSTILGGVMALLFLPLFSAVTMMLCRWLAVKYNRLFLWLFPFIWTSIEYIRTLGVYAFPWMSIAHTQTYYPALIQYADITGVYGVTFWICVLNSAAFFLIERTRKLSLSNSYRSIAGAGFAPSLLIVLLLIIPWLYGRNVMNSGVWLGDTVKISLAQGNVDMSEKSDAELRDYSLALYDSLSHQAARPQRRGKRELVAQSIPFGAEPAEAQPDLIVWPETAVSAYLRLNAKYDRIMREIVQSVDIPILTGSFNAESIVNNGLSTYKYFNAAVLYNSSTAPQIWYSKMRLVPFGEWFPYEDRISFFKSLDFGQAPFTPGKDYTIFTLRKRSPITYGNKRRVSAAQRELVAQAIPYGAETSDQSDSEQEERTVKFSTAICFESVFSDFIQKFNKKGAQFLVVITNNNWFGRTSSLYQHAQISVFRAIENRIGVAHCSNSGISIFIDPYGRVTAKSGVFVKDVLTGDVYYRNANVKPSFYTRNGEKFSQAALIISGIFFIGGFFRKRKNAEN